MRERPPQSSTGPQSAASRSRLTWPKDDPAGVEAVGAVVADEAEVAVDTAATRRREATGEGAEAGAMEEEEAEVGATEAVETMAVAATARGGEDVST